MRNVNYEEKNVNYRPIGIAEDVLYTLNGPAFRNKERMTRKIGKIIAEDKRLDKECSELIDLVQ